MSKEVIIHKEVGSILTKAEKHEITDAPSMATAVSMLSEANKRIDQITEEKEKVTKPLNEALKAERSRWKPAEELGEKIISILRSKISTYQTEQKRIAEAEAKKIEARIGEGKGKLKLETAVAKIEAIDTPEARVSTDAGMVKFRTDLVVKIINPKEVPEKFITEIIWDKKAIQAAYKRGEHVPGTIVEEVQTPINFR